MKVVAMLGLAQTLALIPGVSRSGATIIGGMLFGLSRRAATEFSFFLAVPTLVAAGVYSLAAGRTVFDRMRTDLVPPDRLQGRNGKQRDQERAGGCYEVRHCRPRKKGNCFGAHRPSIESGRLS